MELFAYIGAALVALLVTLLPALAHKHHWNVIRDEWRDPLRLLFGVLAEELGAVTVTYYIRNGSTVAIAGSTTGPTSSQAQQCNKMSAVVVFGVTADAQALFTHNWGLDRSAGFFAEPLMQIEPQSTTTYWPLLTFDRTNTNVFKINKPATDAPTTLLVTLRLPWTPGQ